MSDEQQAVFGPESDPRNFTVEQVNAYLEAADADERARVLALEDAEGGRRRATVTREFAQDGQNPPQEPPAGGGGTDGATEPASAPETGAEPGPVSTKGATFAEAAEVVTEPAPAVGLRVTNTDRLAADGGSKGYTFAEQAEQARALYGDGRL